MYYKSQQPHDKKYILNRPKSNASITNPPQKQQQQQTNEQTNNKTNLTKQTNVHADRVIKVEWIRQIDIRMTRWMDQDRSVIKRTKRRYADIDSIIIQINQPVRQLIE